MDALTPACDCQHPTRDQIPSFQLAPTPVHSPGFLLGLGYHFLSPGVLQKLLTSQQDCWGHFFPQRII